MRTSVLSTTWRPLHAALALSLLVVPTPARGQTAMEQAAAETLFREARDLLQQGNITEACPKFAESNRLEPKLGTLLNLASCHEQQGKVASAWTEFNQAAAIAAAANQEGRAEFARTRASDLEGKLTRVVFQAATGPAEGLSIQLGTQRLGAAALGSKIPIDPGVYPIEVMATGKQRWSTQIDVPTEPTLIEVSIPPLADEAMSEKGTETSGGLSSLFTPAGRRTLSLVVAGVGLVGVGAGAYLGIRTFVQKGVIEDHCQGLFCDQEGLEASRDARTSATLSTITFLAGGALLAGGAVLYLTAPPPSTSSPPKARTSTARKPTLWLSPDATPWGAALRLGGAW
ncbi:hypothetical protein [Chondromyces crocatus]|uniref:PEGA domain-containing protein n=1 Tax=Chondromyces crocatus TaxID=52 RepID=A0A0K1ESG4_CHOCO|nr:hypothetical protein [Chondromyces crocatus]AKT43880.1 uncharacterized protein CMC5_081170 [Chondromyces crocatus]